MKQLVVGLGVGAALFGAALLVAGCSSQSSESESQVEQGLTFGVPYRVRALSFTAFNDSDTVHEGNCGSGPVDAETTTDPNGGVCNVGWTHPGEWLEYSIQVPATKTYDIVSRVASASTGKTFKISIDGQAIGGSQSVPSAGWQAFADRPLTNVTLNQGTHTLRVTFETGDTNLNYIDITPGTVALPAHIEAEDYQRAFESTPATNSGGACDRNDGVDKQTTGDVTGVCNIGWTTAGEWLEYDVSVPQTGPFDFNLRVGSGVTGRTVQVNVDGASIGTVSSPSTGWSTFEDRKIENINLSAGAHVVRVTFTQGDTNLNYLNITSRAVPTIGSGYSFGAAASFNVFVFQDLSVTPTIAGPAAAGRDILASSFGYDTSDVGSIGALAGRNFNGGNGSVHRDLVYGSTLTLSNVGVLDGVSRKASPVDFVAEKATLDSLSGKLAALTTNGTVAISADGTTIDFTGVDPVRDVFTVAGSVLGATDVLRFNVPAAATVLVNVTGSSAVFETTGMQLGAVPPGHLIWNFPQATTLRLAQTGFKGTLLATNAAVSQSASTLDGVVIATSLTGGDNGLTWLPFTGSFPSACASTEDTDRDGVLDCNDACPYDRNKTAPGVCGCGVSDTADFDHDGTPDCIDRCPKDKFNTYPGECGCVGQPNLKAAGAPCNDTACAVPPGTQSTCDGAGQCGNHSVCLPEPNCRFVDWKGNAYWICGHDGASGSTPQGQLGEPAAQQACSAKGMTLARVDSLDQERFLAGFLTTPVWIGANDVSVSNAWRWAKAGSPDGDAFWSGGATGSPVSGRFAFWKAGAPGANRCATMRPGDGRWSDTDCNETHAFLCTYAIPIVIHDPNTDPTIPGTPGTPPPLTNCIPEVDAGLPDSMAELQALHDSIVNGGPPTGAAANPPTSGSCAAEDPSIAAIGIDPKSSRGCKIADQQPGNCANDAQCQGKFGAGYYCRAVPNSFSCTPPDAGTPQRAGCLGSQQCVKITCPADQPPCDEIDICDPGTDLHSSLDPSAQLDAGSFQPQSLFGGTLPDAGSAGQYVDQPDGSGTQHTWCAMTPQAPIATAKQAPGGFKGTSGGGGKIQFEFDPDLIFDVDTSPIALGETTHTIHAAAKLGAKVTVNNFLTANFSQSILDASIGLQAQRCDLDDTKDTQISVFGLDILPFDTLGIPKINSTDPNSCTSTTDTSVACSLYKASRACQGAVNQYSEFANRSKKAFRDAQQLLSQYYAAKKNGGALTTDLCHQLGVDSANVPGFPGGNQCSTAETPEATINRFIDYYQAPGSGQVSQLRQAAMGLAAQSQAVAAMFSGPNPISLQFANFSGEESQTIVNVPFLIGPVPMVLQIDIFAQYGVTGNFVLDLKYPLNLDSGPGGDPKQVAHVEADVVPFAGAGLDAFVGAGFDLGVISATIGLEGAVTLADLKAPIFAGAGFDVAVTADNRPLPDDIQPPVAAASDAFQFVGGAKSFKFFVTYDYGAGVDIDHVLSGEINGRLRISFAFFSRTWRKRVIHFDGWHAHFDLIHGGSDPSVATSKLTVPNTDKTDRDTTNVSNGQNALGLSEAQVPLMQLGRLTVPSTPTPGSVQFDATKVQSLFYDKQCCFKTGEVCSTSGTGTGGCCPGETCKGSNAPPPDGGPDLAIGTCQCDDTGVICTASTQCCGFDTGTVVCGSQHACRQCIGKGLACDSPLDCCNQECNFGRCAPPPG